MRISVLCAALLLTISGAAVQAADTLFHDVRVFDGKSSSLSEPSDVLVENNLIKTISTTPIDPGDGTTVIEGNGRVLMPGLIDAHWHTMLIMVPPDPATMNIGYANIAAGVQATRTLMRGFTTVRDLGGAAFGLKRAIDEGLVPGPRIYPSGAILTVTSGHGDFRNFNDLPRRPGVLTPLEEAGMVAVVDSPDEVRMRTREQLMQGASQIKMTAGGGVASPFSPLDVSTFTDAEIRAAVEAADNWGTYVTVHAYTSRAIITAINSGVKVIEHGHLMDDAAARLMAEKGIWLSTQPFDESIGLGVPPSSMDKFNEVLHGTDNVYEFAKKYGIKTAFGTDILFAPPVAERQGAILVNLLKWYTPAEALAQATGNNGELLLLTGERNPYPGKLGVVEEGAYADLLLVEGNPLEDLALVADPETNFRVIMKDGVIYKNTLDMAETTDDRAAMEPAGAALPPEAIGTVWQWVSFTTPKEQIDVDDPARYTLELAADGSAALQVDCNRGVSQYTLEPDNRISFSPAGVTMMMCVDDQLGHRFTSELERVVSWFQQDGDFFLELPMDSGTFRFRQAPASQ